MAKGLIYTSEEHLRNFLRKFKCEEDIVEILVNLFNEHVDNTPKIVPYFKLITYSISSNSDEKLELFRKLRLMWESYNKLGKLDLKFMNNKIEEVKIDENLNKPKTKTKLMMKNRDFYVEISEEYNPPNSHGVYFLYNENKELEYIGKSNNLASRIYNSALERGSIYARYIEMKTLADTHIMEMYFIGKYKPIKNSDSKSKDEVTFDIKDYGEASMSDYFKVLNIICKVEEWKPSRLIQ